MAIQKKSLIGKTQSAKKALVAKRVSTDTPKAAQVKAPLAGAHQHSVPYKFSPNRSATPYKFSPSRTSTPYKAL